MKTALIANYWKNSDGGGIKTYLVNLVDALETKGADVSVLFREGDDPEHFCGGKNKVAFSFNCYRHLQKIRPKVIYSQGTWYCLLPGVLYKKFHGCTLVHTFHTEPDRGLPFPGRVFFQTLLNACNLFVLPSLNEGEGNTVVIFEILDCCRRIFVETKVGRMPEVITSDEYGPLVESGDAGDLAEKILVALDKEWVGERSSRMRSGLRGGISHKNHGNNLQIELR